MKKLFLLIAVIGGLLLAAGCGLETPTSELVFLEGKTIEKDGEILVAAFFDYTNNSGETQLPCEDIAVSAFQDGIELTILVYTGEQIEGAIQCDTAVQNGITARTVWTFIPNSETPVTIECSNGQCYQIDIH